MTYDVIEISLSNPRRVLSVVATDKSDENAEAIVNMAVMRRGVEESFFTKVKHGQYSPEELYRE